MTWQRNDSIVAELRLAQLELEHLLRGMTLLPVAIQQRLLPDVAELEKKIETLQNQLE